MIAVVYFPRLLLHAPSILHTPSELDEIEVIFCRLVPTARPGAFTHHNISLALAC